MTRVGAGVLLLALAACAGTERAAPPGPASSPPAATASAATPAPAPSPSSGATTTRCENPAEGYALRYPATWSMGGGPGIEPCTFFDEAPLGVLEPGTEVPGIAIRVDVRDVPLQQARRDTGGEQQDTVVAGRPAVRAEGVEDDDPLLPPGTRFTTWLVDVGARTLLVTTDDAAGGDADERVEVLDAMVGSLELV